MVFPWLEFSKVSHVTWFMSVILYNYFSSCINLIFNKWYKSQTKGQKGEVSTWLRNNCSVFFQIVKGLSAVHGNLLGDGMRSLFQQSDANAKTKVNIERCWLWWNDTSREIGVSKCVEVREWWHKCQTTITIKITLEIEISEVHVNGAYICET